MFGKIVFISIIAIPILIYLVSKVFEMVANRKAKEDAPKRSYDSKILVDLSKCELKSNVSTDLVEIGNYQSRPNAFMLLTQNKSSDVKTQDKHCTFIEYNHELKKYVGGPVYKDIISVQVRMFKKKHTYIYFDQADPLKYYFDLEFLYEN
jgi:hypothetical protein